MPGLSEDELRRLAERFGLTALRELDPGAFRDALASAEILRTSLREPASAFEEPLHVARLPQGWDRTARD